MYIMIRILTKYQGHGWEQFTDAVINAVNMQDRPIVYMLWGSPAQRKASMLNNPKHLILKAPHPSHHAVLYIYS